MKRKPDPYRKLSRDVTRVAKALFKEYGPESSVVVMVGIPDGKQHSAFVYQWWEGRCLPVEGLLERVAGEIKKEMWKGK